MSKFKSFASSFETTMIKLEAARFQQTKQKVAMGVLSVASILPMLANMQRALGADTYNKFTADSPSTKSERNANMVHYSGESWSYFSDCSNRGGCNAIITIVKVIVKPQALADLSTKRVGVGYKLLGRENEWQSVEGKYFTTLADGTEEWHVPIAAQRYNYYSNIVIAPWYFDGKGNSFFDDNNGDLYAVSSQQNGVIFTDFNETTVTLDDAGVHGRIALRIAGFGYDKDIKFVYSTDNWKTVKEIGMGAIGDKNGWYWVESLWDGYEKWFLDLDLPSDIKNIQYAIVYKHGLHGKVFEFWDNNYGQNYALPKPQ